MKSEERKGENFVARKQAVTQREGELCGYEGKDVLKAEFEKKMDKTNT